MGIQSDLTTLSTKEATLTSNKVSRFAYTQNAYDNDNADGVTVYDVNQEQNIPVGTPSVMKVNDTVVEKGWRARASSITRMLMNHFLGRLSYNVNKVNDIMASLLSSLSGSLGSADGIATLDANGRIPYSQLPESAVEYKGGWNANTNTPTLADGTGTNGDMYIVEVAGTQNLGSGNITFFVNDRVIYNGSVWQRFSAGDVKSVNGVTPSSTTGDVEITGADTDVSGSDTRKISNAISSIENDISNLQGNFSDVPIENSGKGFTAGGAFGFFNECTDKDTWLGKVFGREIGKAWKVDTTLEGLPITSGSSAGCPYFYWKDKKIWLFHVDSVLYWSEDLKTFTPVTLDPVASSRFIQGFVASEDKVFIIYSQKVGYCSSDGKTWEACTYDASFASSGVRNFMHADDIYIAVMGGSGNIKVCWSENGRDWTVGLTYSTRWTVKEGDYFFTGGQGSDGYYWSEDGKSWTQVTGTLASYQISAPIFYYNGVYVLGTNGHGLWWSTDGKNWSQASGASTTAKFSQNYKGGFILAHVGHDKLYIAGQEGSTYYIYYSSNGQSWTKVSSPVSSDAIIDFREVRGVGFALFYTGDMCQVKTNGMTKLTTYTANANVARIDYHEGFLYTINNNGILQYKGEGVDEWYMLPYAVAYSYQLNYCDFVVRYDVRSFKGMRTDYICASDATHLIVTNEEGGVSIADIEALELDF